MTIFAIIIGAIIGDILPAACIIFLIRLIFKKKLSKGWCILAGLISIFTTWLIGYMALGPRVQLGFIDYAIHITMISAFLYDNHTISIFDTEKEIKRKKRIRL